MADSGHPNTAVLSRWYLCCTSLSGHQFPLKKKYTLLSALPCLTVFKPMGHIGRRRVIFLLVRHPQTWPKEEMVKSTDELIFLMSKHLYQQQLQQLFLQLCFSITPTPSQAPKISLTMEAWPLVDPKTNGWEEAIFRRLRHWRFRHWRFFQKKEIVGPDIGGQVTLEALTVEAFSWKTPRGWGKRMHKGNNRWGVVVVVGGGGGGGGGGRAMSGTYVKDVQ